MSRRSAVCMPIRLNQLSIGYVMKYLPQIFCLLSHSYNPDNMNETADSRSADIYRYSDLLCPWIINCGLPHCMLQRLHQSFPPGPEHQR